MAMSCLITHTTPKRDLVMETFHFKEPMRVQGNRHGHSDMYDGMNSALWNVLLDKRKQSECDLRTDGFLLHVV